MYLLEESLQVNQRMTNSDTRPRVGCFYSAFRGGASFCTLFASFALFLAFPAPAVPDAAPAAPQRSAASIANAGFNDGIDRSDPNFVTASLLWLGAGGNFFGCAGHSSIRLECPTFNLDFCFTCESEGINEHFFRFLMGDLKTGMFAVPTKDFLAEYEKVGRSATQYKLVLPPDVKQRLWKILDDEVRAGRYLRYDYIKYCCVQTMLQPLLKAIPPYELKTAPWPDVYKLTRREVLANDLEWCPWTRFFLHTVAGTEVDREVSPFKAVILSRDFVNLLKGATIQGRHIIEDDGEVLIQSNAPKKTTVITPMIVAGLAFVVACINLLVKSKGIDWAFLAIQSLLGLLLSHLLFVSRLPATDWNWLIVPFNLLPTIFWKWRQKWALWFAAALVLWECGMILYPHRLTDSAYLVLVVAYIGMYARIGWPQCLRQRT